MTDVAAALRRSDPDRWFTTLFAPAAARDTLVTLYAFNHELARAPEAAREPGLALIRLQWWREVVEGASRAHQVAAPLRAALADGRLDAGYLLAMIDARETEVDGDLSTLSGWRNWLLAGAGSLCVAAGHALGAPPDIADRLRSLGAGYAAAGQLRNIAAFARQGRSLLPADLVAAHGLDPGLVLTYPEDARLDPVRERLAAEGCALLGPALPCGRDWLAAALPAVLGRRDLARWRRPAVPRLLGDRLAVTQAALTRRA